MDHSVNEPSSISGNKGSRKMGQAVKLSNRLRSSLTSRRQQSLSSTLHRPVLVADPPKDTSRVTWTVAFQARTTVSGAAQSHTLFSLDYHSRGHMPTRKEIKPQN